MYRLTHFIFHKTKTVLFLGLLTFSTFSFSQTVYPDLENILACTQRYMLNHEKQFSLKKETIVYGFNLGPCELYTTILQDYTLIAKKTRSKDKKTNYVLGYLLTKSTLGDNEIATLKHLAKFSLGYSPGYLDQNYNFISYFRQLAIQEGTTNYILMEQTMPLPIARTVVKTPDKNLALEILLEISNN